MEHEVGFVANLRALLTSLLDREDLPVTRPIIIVVLRDLDRKDRHKADMPYYQGKFAEIVDEMKAELSAGRADIMERMVCLLRLQSITLLLTFENSVHIKLVALPHPEDHHERNVTHCTESAREQSAREQFKDVARHEIAEIIAESRPPPTLWLSPHALAHAMQTSLVSARIGTLRGRAYF